MLDILLKVGAPQLEVKWYSKDYMIYRYTPTIPDKVTYKPNKIRYMLYTIPLRYHVCGLKHFLLAEPWGATKTFAYKVHLPTMRLHVARLRSVGIPGGR